MNRLDLSDETLNSLRELDTASYNFLIETLETFCARAIEKFIAGQKEHGGTIYHRPMLPELEKEIIDALFYYAGAKRRAELGEKEI